MGIVSIDLNTGDVKAPKTVATRYDALSGKTEHKTKWVKVGSKLKKAPITAKGDRWHPGKKRKQTRTLVKPRKPKTKTLMSGNKYDYEKYVGKHSQ